MQHTFYFKLIEMSYLIIFALYQSCTSRLHSRDIAVSFEYFTFEVFFF